LVIIAVQTLLMRILFQEKGGGDVNREERYEKEVKREARVMGSRENGGWVLTAQQVKKGDKKY